MTRNAHCDLLLPVTASSMDANEGSSLGEVGLAKDKAVFNTGDTTAPFECGEQGGGCLSFSASSPSGVGPSMRVGGPNRSSGFSLEVGKYTP